MVCNGQWNLVLTMLALGEDAAAQRRGGGASGQSLVLFKQFMSHKITLLLITPCHITPPITVINMVGWDQNI